MHYQCENCHKMIQDVWRMITLKSKNDEIYFCSDSCKEEYKNKDKNNI